MRLSSLVSIAVVGPLLLALSTSEANAASPAPAKRSSSSRAPAARVLPAPAIANVDSLPPLPAAPRDVTSFTTVTSAPVPSESPEALPSPPASPPPVVADVKPADPLREGSDPKLVKPSGFVLQFGSGVLAPASSFARGASTVGPGVSLDVRLGYYVSPHVGVIVGFRGSYAHEGGMCEDDSKCKGYSLQAPLLLQFARTDRARGLYGEIGVGLGTTYGASGDGYTVKVSSPAELKLGTGYRIAGAGDVARTLTLDMSFGVDIGTMTKVEAQVGSTKLKADIASADHTTHVVLALSLIAHFSL
jgi:hypothetical protein